MDQLIYTIREVAADSQEQKINPSKPNLVDFRDRRIFPTRANPAGSKDARIYPSEPTIRLLEKIDGIPVKKGSGWTRRSKN